MSHVVEIEVTVKITDEETLAAACKRLGLELPVWGPVKLYSETLDGLSVKLPGWTYPIVVDLETAVVKADNFNGRWGRIEELTKLEQAYQTEQVLKTARDSCMFSSINETTLADGSIQISLMAY